jgi:hypothetical protein
MHDEKRIDGWRLNGEQRALRRAEAAEAKLETLRSGLKAEVEQLRRTPINSRRWDRSLLTADRLQQLLDASEDTEGGDAHDSRNGRHVAEGASEQSGAPSTITLPLVEAMALIKPERVLEAEEFWGEAADRAERKILAATQPETLAVLDAASEDTDPPANRTWTDEEVIDFALNAEHEKHSGVIRKEYEVIDPPASFTDMQSGGGDES